MAVLHLESGGGWIGAKDAAHLSGVRAANLRRWAERGVISVIRDPGQHRHYYIPELALLAFWGKEKDEPLNLIALTNHIAVMLAPAYNCEST
ncbi:MerR family DNA-binding transcriptional regulator [Actinomadura meridiana]|uniref:MerR family DNA-binding transcriptional regulator n=1 Tax=Actinomadura meridiana TaxID=559626 RepID=UPI003CD05A72